MIIEIKEKSFLRKKEITIIILTLHVLNPK